MKNLYQKIRWHLRFLIQYYMIHKADPISYLRFRGAGIGNNCDLLCGIKCVVSEPYLIRLGNNVTLSGGVLLLTHDGATRVFRADEPRWHLGTGVYGRIDVGDNVFIGMNSIVLPGVTIGSNTIIGAGSVVVKDVPPGTVVAGNPASLICSIEDYRERAIKKAVTILDTQNKQVELNDLFWGKK